MSLPRFDPSAPGLVLAPHLSYPTRDGADISLDRVARHLSRHLPWIDLIAADVRVRFERGELVDRQPFKNAIRSQRSGAIRALLRGSHYLLERFVTDRFRQQALEKLDDSRYGFVLYSYVCTASLAAEAAPRPGRLSAVWTHNDQIKWFRNLRESFGNPVLKLVAYTSEQWYFPFFGSHRDDFVFLYVTPEDRNGHVRQLGPHRNLIVPIGVDVDVNLAERPPELVHGAVRLLFVGSLGARMNLDALQHFAVTFAPALRAHFGKSLEVVIAGSSPSPAVRALCQRNRWDLRANVSDEGLALLYAGTSYALLPFPYTTGAKLKLLGALAHGTPFLATTGVDAQISELPPGCLVSDAPDRWVAHVASTPHPSSSLRHGLHERAREYDWEFVVERMVRALSDEGLE